MSARSAVLERSCCEIHDLLFTQSLIPFARLNTHAHRDLQNDRWVGHGGIRTGRGNTLVSCASKWVLGALFAY